MLKLISNVSRRVLVLGALALCLTTTAAWAVQEEIEYLFPGVDAGGNLNDNNGTYSTIIANVNTKNGNFTARGKAQVQNLSVKKQTYKNTPLDISGVTVKSSRYIVSKTGAASLVAHGTAGLL